MAIGEATAEAQIIITMHNNGFTAEQIAAATDKEVADVEAIIVGRNGILSEL